MHNTHHQLLTLLTGQVPTQKAAMKARVIMGSLVRKRIQPYQSTENITEQGAAIENLFRKI